MSTDHPFLQASTWRRSGDGVYEGELDERWRQGRGAYGGILAASILRALGEEVQDSLRIPRTLSVHFAAAALPGPMRLVTTLERATGRITHASARLFAGEDPAPACIATATFAAPRAESIDYERARMPDVFKPEHVPPLPPIASLPEFVRFFELRFCIGGLPFSGARDPVVGGWVRPRAPLALDAPLAAALLDAWPPGVLSLMSAPRPAASVDFTIHFFTALPLANMRASAPWLVTVDSSWAGEGYSEELRVLWSEDGRRIAQCRQFIALI